MPREDVDPKDLAKKEEFLKRLEALYEEFGLIVDACGCCESPWVRTANPPALIKTNLSHLRDGPIL